MRTYILAMAVMLSIATGVSAQVFTDVASIYGVGDGCPAVNAMWLDYDNDGDLDILVAANYFHTLLRNEGAMFVDVASSVGLGQANQWTQALTGGDYDNDGDIDILITSTEDKNLFRNDVNQTEGFTALGYYGEGAFVDYDNDGNLDIYQVSQEGLNQLYRNDDGVLTEISDALGLADFRFTRTAVWGDFDGDGDMDVYVVNGRQQRSSL